MAACYGHKGEWDFFVTQALVRYWVAEGIHESVVNVGIEAGVVAIKERVIYGSSKADVTQMTHVLALELGQYGNRVNAVAPTFLWTKFAVVTMSGPRMEEKLTSRIPLERLGALTDVAPAMAFYSLGRPT